MMGWLFDPKKEVIKIFLLLYTVSHFSIKGTTVTTASTATTTIAPSTASTATTSVVTSSTSNTVSLASAGSSTATASSAVTTSSYGACICSTITYTTSAGVSSASVGATASATSTSTSVATSAKASTSKNSASTSVNSASTTSATASATSTSTSVATSATASTSTNNASTSVNSASTTAATTTTSVSSVTSASASATSVSFASVTSQYCVCPSATYTATNTVTSISSTASTTSSIGTSTANVTPTTATSAASTSSAAPTTSSTGTLAASVTSTSAPISTSSAAPTTSSTGTLAASVTSTSAPTSTSSTAPTTSSTGTLAASVTSTSAPTSTSSAAPTTSSTGTLAASVTSTSAPISTSSAVPTTSSTGTLAASVTSTSAPISTSSAAPTTSSTGTLAASGTSTSAPKSTSSAAPTASSTGSLATLTTTASVTSTSSTAPTTSSTGTLAASVTSTTSISSTSSVTSSVSSSASAGATTATASSTTSTSASTSTVGSSSSATPSTATGSTSLATSVSSSSTNATAGSTSISPSTAGISSSSSVNASRSVNASVSSTPPLSSSTSVNVSSTKSMSISTSSISPSSSSSVVASSSQVIPSDKQVISTLQNDSRNGIILESFNRGNETFKLHSSAKINFTDGYSYQNVTFQTYIDGNWTTITNLPYNFSTGSQIRFVPKKGMFGPIIFDVNIYNTSSSKDYILLIAVLPESVMVMLNSNVSKINIVRLEDSPCNSPVNISGELGIKNETDIFTVREFDKGPYRQYFLNASKSGPYFQMRDAFLKDLMPGYWVKTIDRDNGKWSYNKDNSSIKFPSFFRDKYFIPMHAAICYKPDSNFVGTASMVFSPAVYSNKTKKILDFGREMVNIIVNVTNVNDKPVLNKLQIRAPVLPYNLSDVSGAGFLVSDLLDQAISKSTNVKIASDPDGGLPGLAIVFGQSSAYGKWEYSCNGTFLEVFVNNTLPFGDNGTLNTILLKPTDRIRFNLTGDQYWNLLKASDLVKFEFMAWDQSDNQSCGYETFNTTVAMPSSLSKKSGVVTQLRKGCDGIAGTVAAVDECGVCGGDNTTCLGCDGVLNSGAVIDDCLNCTGGNTNKSFNYLLDCAQTCGLAFTDNCGVCQIKSAYRNLSDCAGVCFGNATINKCGNCVGGNTTKPSTYGEDECGVCGGNNSTCLDCAGVPNGGKVIDLCGDCLLPTDDLYNSNCSKLGSFSPQASYKTAGTVVEIVGSGMARFSSVICQFHSGGQSVSGTNAGFVVDRSNKKTGAKVTTPTFTSGGIYYISCTFDSNNIINATGSFYVIDNATITVTSTSPNVTAINTAANVTVTGTNFLNSPEVVCLYDKKQRQTLTAVYVSATSVVCKLPAQQKSIMSDLVLSFVAKQRQNHLYFKAAHYISINGPAVKSARFAETLGSVKLEFYQRATFLTAGTTCQDVFPYHYSKFGSKGKCKFVADKILKIKLVDGPTLTPEPLYIDLTKIIIKGAEYTVHVNKSQNITITSPTLTPDIELIGPSTVGLCDKIPLRVNVKGGNGGRKLTYAYSVSYSAQNSGAASGQVSAVLAALNSTLQSVSQNAKRYKVDKNDTFIGVYLQFTVIATNFLSQSSSGSLTVLRENKNLPTVLIGALEVETTVDRAVTLKAKAQLSPCIDKSSDAARVLFAWQIEPSVGISLPVMDKANLRIPKGTLKAGKGYTATVKVSMASDVSLFSTETVTINVLTQPLEARIQGPQTVGSLGNLTLDASKSSDPDDSSDTPSYRWEVRNTDKSAVIVGGRTITIPSGVVANINVANSLPSGNDYEFTLTFRKSSRSAQATQIVTVVKGDPPKVVFRPLEDRVNPSDKIVLRALIKSPSSGNFSWSCEEVDGSAQGRTYDSIELTRAEAITPLSGTFGKAETAVLVLRSDVLSSNVYYRFMLTATNIDGEAKAYIDFKTNGAPSAGVLNVSPLNGTALNTSFEMTAPEGWVDPDGDALSFVFGYIAPDRAVLFSSQVETIITTQLPPGNLTMVVYCYDTFGAFSSATVNVYVERAAISDAAYGNLEQQMAEAAALGDVGGLLGESMTVMLSTDSSGSPSSAQIGFQESTTQLVLSSIEGTGVQDEEYANQASNGLAALTTGAAANFGAALKANIISNMLTLVQGISSNKRRRRRAVGGGSVTAKSPSEVEQDLQTFVNVIDPQAYDSNSQSSKTQFLSSLNSLSPSLCKYFSIGEPAGIAKSSLVILQALMKGFSDVDTNEIQLGCFNCSSNLLGPDFVLLGNYLKTTYESFSCDTGETCTGACVTSAQMPNDLLSSSFNSSLMSGVLLIKLWNPQTFDELVVNNVPGGMAVRQIPTTATNKSYLCHRWDSSGSMWTLDGVETVTKKAVASGNVSYVTCNMTKMGYLALFEGPEVIEPSTSSVSIASMSSSISPSSTAIVSSSSINTTQGTTTTTTLTPVNYVRQVTFTFPNANCTVLFNSSTRPSFIHELRQKIADAANITASTMIDFNITCGSIIVTYKQSHTANQTSAAAVTAVQNLVTANALNITIGGQQLNAEQSSFSSTTIIPPYATTTPVPSDDDDGLSDGAIAGIVIGVLAFVIIVIGLLYYFCIRKQTRKDPTVEPNDNVLELRGKSNQGYSTSP